MLRALELSVLFVAVVFAWRRTSAGHLRLGRSKLAARIGALGAAITAFVVVLGLIFVLDPPPGFPGKSGLATPASAPATVAEPATHP